MSKRYKIVVNYDTGDSFSQRPGQEEEITHGWNNLEVAKENLQRISEHYKAYGKINGWNNYGKSAWTDYTHERWYCNGYPEFTVRLLTDDGGSFDEHCTWCGYFETMNFAEIKVDDSDGMKIYGGH